MQCSMRYQGIVLRATPALHDQGRGERSGSGSMYALVNSASVCVLVLRELFDAVQHVRLARH